MRLLSLYHIVLLVSLIPGGCSAPLASPHYRTVLPREPADFSTAAAANELGLTAAIHGDYESAARHFRQALAADMAHAAAHNNLGLVLLHNGHCYESAVEFSLARRLQPRSVEPIINLGRLYDTIGWHRQAIAAYEDALALDRDHTVTLGLLARAYLNTEQEPDRAQALLRRLAQDAEAGRWNLWAVAQLGKETTEQTKAKIEH